MIIFNNYFVGKILEIFRKIIIENFQKFSGKYEFFWKIFSRPTSLPVTAKEGLV